MGMRRSTDRYPCGTRRLEPRMELRNIRSARERVLQVGADFLQTFRIISCIRAGPIGCWPDCIISCIWAGPIGCWAGVSSANAQQALNCLEGPRGPDFRRSAGDPCGGAGVVNELPDGSVNKLRVEKAIRLAAVGVTFHDFDPAHYTALAVRAVLAEGTG